MSDPGRTFEAQLIASLPPWRHLHGRIVPDHPAAFIADRQGAEGARFVRPNPWDVEIRWRIEPRSMYPEDIRAAGSYEILAECKSTQAARLPFSALKGRKHPKTDKEILWQERELRAVADAGAFAGILWECRRWEPVRLAVWVPIAAWRARRLAGRRKSLAWEEARADGILIRPDSERMKRARTRTYYNLASLLCELAGGAPQP